MPRKNSRTIKYLHLNNYNFDKTQTRLRHTHGPHKIFPRNDLDDFTKWEHFDILLTHIYQT